MKKWLEIGIKSLLFLGGLTLIIIGCDDTMDKQMWQNMTGEARVEQNPGVKVIEKIHLMEEEILYRQTTLPLVEIEPGQRQ